VKIFIPFDTRIGGGTASFVNKFGDYLKKQGHFVTNSYSINYDILFVVAQCKFRYLWDAKIKGKKIIQRLDGVYYPMSVVGKNYRFFNLHLKIIRKYFADYCIYQSKYSEKVCNIYLGAINKPKTIIYNGVDVNTFSHEGVKCVQKDSENQKIFVTTGRFRRADQIVPLLDMLELFRKKYDDNFVFYVIGALTDELKKIVDNYKNLNIKCIENVANAKLPGYLRSCDVFLFSSLNPPCPNSVIEAMSCGLPICGIADGSMLELTEGGKNSELVATQGEGFMEGREIDIIKMVDNFKKILDYRESYAKRSREIAVERLGIERMAQDYLKIFNEINYSE